MPVLLVPNPNVAAARKEQGPETEAAQASMGQGSPSVAHGKQGAGTGMVEAIDWNRKSKLWMSHIDKRQRDKRQLEAPDPSG